MPKSLQHALTVHVTANDMGAGRVSQLGDRPRLDQGLGNFQSFNEPFYNSYINDNLGAAPLSPQGVLLHAVVHKATVHGGTGHMPFLWLSIQ